MMNRIVGLMLACGAAVQAQQLVDVDRTILMLELQREYLAAVKTSGKPAATLRRASAALSAREPLQSRKLLLQSLAEMKGIEWTEAHSAVSAYGFRIGETVVEPKSNIHAVVERIGQAGPAEEVRLRAQLKVLNGAGETVFAGRERPIEDMMEAETSAPAPAVEGKYTVVVSIKDGGGGAALAVGRNDIWVVAGLRSRLSALAEGAQAAVLLTPSDSGMIWLNTILGITGHYSAARSTGIRSGWQTSSPLVQTLVAQAGHEPLDPMADIAWAERTLAGISKGQSPVGEGGRWTPMAASASGDQGPVLARVWWPKGEAAGIAVLMGDVLTNERSWEDVNPTGPYVCIAPSFRRGFLWENVEGVVAAAAKAAGLKERPLSMFVHGVGARDGLKQAEKEPSKFSAVAAVAPLSDQPLTAISKTFPPFLLMEAEKDGILPGENLRRAGVVLERKLEKFEYAVLPGVDHETAKGPALARALEFFKSIAAGTWKRSQ